MSGRAATCEPNIKTSARDALATAYVEALKVLKANAASERDRARLDWALERAEALERPVRLSDRELARYAGIFGLCRTWVEGGQLRIQRGNEPPFLLVPLSMTVFVSETSDAVRLEYLAGSDGIISEIVFTDEDRLSRKYRKDR